MPSHVGDKWVDFSGYRPTVEELRARNVKGVSRYLSALNANGEPRPQVQWKVATRAECQRYLEGGIDVILNYEWYEGRMLEGAPAGKQDGAWAKLQAAEIGYPKGASIYFSHDTGEINLPAISAYLDACQDVIGSDYRVDMYAGRFVYEPMKEKELIRYGWQAVASSWSGGAVGNAAMLQTAVGAQMDDNKVQAAPFGSWRQTSSGHGTDAVDLVPLDTVQVRMPELRLGVRHPAVVIAKAILRHKFGQPVALDGPRREVFGADCGEAVLNAQRWVKATSHPEVVLDGWIGEQTWELCLLTD
jgi:hypothetical protein